MRLRSQLYLWALALLAAFLLFGYLLPSILIGLRWLAAQAVLALPLLLASAALLLLVGILFANERRWPRMKPLLVLADGLILFCAMVYALHETIQVSGSRIAGFALLLLVPTACAFLVVLLTKKLLHVVQRRTADDGVGSVDRVASLLPVLGGLAAPGMLLVLTAGQLLPLLLVVPLIYFIDYGLWNQLLATLAFFAIAIVVALHIQQRDGRYAVSNSSRNQALSTGAEAEPQEDANNATG